MDSKPHYDVAAGLIWKDGKLLITKRPRGTHLEGFWEFPGGKREKGESLTACLEREIKEELGLEVRSGKALLTVHHEYESKKISLHIFQCAPVSGEPRPLESQEVRWVAPTELRYHRFPPPDLQVLEFIQGKPMTAGGRSAPVEV
jgi:8-oxo-dGTP diphosphatase